MQENRIYSGVVRPQYTPENLSSLGKDEIFVFGSVCKG